MAWIESHTVLSRHRKCLELAFDLNVKVVQVLGHLHALWHTVLEQQEDGDLSRWSDAMIAQAALWDGIPSEFVTRLREREWLDGSLVHDWIDYVGPYLIKKYSSGDVDKLKHIWLVHGLKYGKGNGKFCKQKASKKRVESERKATIPLPSLPNPSSPNPSLPNPSSPDLTKPKEEELVAGAAKALTIVPKPDVVTVAELVALWNEIPGVTPMREAAGPVKDRIVARLREHHDLDWWRTLFQRVQQSDFLCGRKTDFAASLDWVLGPKNLAKLKAGNYDNRKQANGYDALREAFVNS